MRSLILRAALLAADTDPAAGVREVHTSAPQADAPTDPEPVAKESEPAPTAPAALTTATLAMPVIVRQSTVLAAGIVVEEDAGHGIAVQIFRGDHRAHAAHHVKRADPAGTDDGWFFPWERVPTHS